ncbi:MAG: sulfatase-like hydrolase/transferase [Muribaculaceae bacterium]|nr:sulfatase-like hydrolase/transferase [Muribaculaceae bacterium]
MNKVSNSFPSMIKSPVVAYYIAILVALYIEWAYFALSVGGFGNSTVFTLCKGVGDCMMLLILYWILPKRFIWIEIVIVWMLSIFFILNLWYFRFWNEMITPLFYRLWSNINGDTVASVKALVSGCDLIFLFCPVAVLVLYFMYKDRIGDNRELAGCRNRIRIIMTVTTVCVFFISQIGYAVTQSKWNKSVGYRNQTVVANFKANFTDITNASVYVLRIKGLPLYLYTSLVNMVEDLAYSHDFEPTPKDLKELNDFISETPHYPVVEEFEANDDKNVIIILVESLNADVIGESVNGHEITPFLNSLIKSEGTISAVNVLPQVKDGCSNDGQMLTNTGLLPLSRGVASMSLSKDLVYPGLPKILRKKSSVAVFGDAGMTWNQTQAYKDYGFEKTYSILDYEDSAEMYGNDAAMFDFSKAVLDTVRHPFLMEFVTFSSHAPFTHKNINTQEWLGCSGLDSNEINYLNSINYTDLQIRRFFETLRQRELLESSVIFIVSDHSQTLGLNKNKVKDIKEDTLDLLPMVFIAVNTGVTKKIMSPVGQVDVFPTILHVLNKGEEGYRGLGRSLLDTALSSSVSAKGVVRGSSSEYEINRQKRAWQVSDSLLRSNFFSRKL